VTSEICLTASHVEGCSPSVKYLLRRIIFQSADVLEKIVSCKFLDDLFKTAKAWLGQYYGALRNDVVLHKY
jgi:hypothetical protein